MSKKHLIILIIVFFIGITGVAFYYVNVNKMTDELIDCDTTNTEQKADNNYDNNADESLENINSIASDSENNSKDSATNESNSDSTIYIHICGQVNKPGVYELKGNARIIDAIEAAGGLTKKAVSEAINQAKKLEDSEQIYIPSKEEVKKNVYNANVSSSVNNTSDVSSASDFTTNNSYTNASNNSSGSSKGSKININTASLEELTTLPGIGTAKANKIIEYRQSNGSFRKIEDIMKISGIKEGLFNKISANITV